MRGWWAGAAAGVVVIGAEAAAGMSWPATVADAAAGGSMFAVAVVAWRSSGRLALLAGLAGVAWFAGGLLSAVVWWHRPLMAHCVLAFPSGRMPGMFARIVIGVMWIAACVPALARAETVSIALGAVQAVVGWLVAARAPMGGRPEARTAARAGTALAAALLAAAFARVFLPESLATAGSGAYAGFVALSGLIMAGGLLARTVATDAVIELTGDDPARAAAALRREADRAEAEGHEVGNALMTALQLLEANLALQRELAGKVDEVRLSRRRLVEAAVLERRRLEQRLASHVVPLLDELTETLRALQRIDGSALVGECAAEIARTRADLDQLAHGLHPPLLAQEGLAAALRDLASRTPVPVSVRVPQVRLPMLVESTVWYACAEALTNAVKHATATSIVVAVSVQDDVVTAEVSDNGAGGARVHVGGGIAGIIDRLDAAGGALSIESPAGEGTRVRMRVPLS